jgi:hypothetical protein
MSTSVERTCEAVIGSEWSEFWPKANQSKFFFKIRKNINGNQSSHSSIEENAEVQISRSSSLLPLWKEAWIYARL